jgi:hypothetical protein
MGSTVRYYDRCTENIVERVPISSGYGKSDVCRPIEIFQDILCRSKQLHVSYLLIRRLQIVTFYSHAYY